MISSDSDRLTSVDGGISGEGSESRLANVSYRFREVMVNLDRVPRQAERRGKT